MVWGIPSKQKGKKKNELPEAGRARGNQRGGAAPAARGGNKHDKDKDATREKQALLAQLTRAAEDNTRILERERAALLALEIENVEHLTYSNGQEQRHPQQQPQQQHHPQPAGLRAGQQGGRGGGNNRSHMYLDDGNRRRVDPAQVPGLTLEPPATLQDTFPGHANLPDEWGQAMQGNNEFEGTFPSTPGFRVGMVFRVPGAAPDGDAPAPPSPQNARQPRNGRGSGGPAPPFMGTFNPMDPTVQRGGGGPGYGPGPPSGWGQQGTVGAPPQWQQQQQQQQQRTLSTGFPDERQARATKQEQYRAELEQQIRAKSGAKQAEVAARQREEMQWMQQQQHAAMQQQQDGRQQQQYDHRSPSTMMGNGGGGGGGGGRGAHYGGSPRQYGDGVGNQQQYGRGTGSVRRPPPPQLQVPGLEGHLPSPGQRGGHQGGGGYQQDEQMRHLGGMHASPSAAAAAAYGGGGGAVASPGADQRRFLAGLNELRAGPSEEQRSQADAARRQLQADLQEQIRQKKARQEAEQERERLAQQREDNELAQYHARSAAQREEEVRQQRQRAGLLDDGGGGGRPGGGGATTLAAGPSAFKTAESFGRPGRKKDLIDASWLDAVPPSGGPLPRTPPGGGGGGGPAGSGGATRFGRRADVSDTGGSPWGPSDAVGVVGGSGVKAIGGEVGSLLEQMHREQVRLREEFARQASAMEQLATEAAKAARERDRAWSELHRARSALGGRGGAGGGGRSFLSAGHNADSLDQFAVDTHLIPKSMSAIPDALPNPLEQSYLRASMAHTEANLAGGTRRQLPRTPEESADWDQGWSAAGGDALSSPPGHRPPTPTRAGQPNRFGYVAEHPRAERPSMYNAPLPSIRPRQPLMSNLMSPSSLQPSPSSASMPRTGKPPSSPAILRADHRTTPPEKQARVLSSKRGNAGGGGGGGGGGGLSTVTAAAVLEAALSRHRSRVGH